MKPLEAISRFITGIFGDRFKIVYWVIAAATAQHTAWGAATTMQGVQGEDAAWWWLQGLAFAIAIDVSMVMVATKIRSGGNRNTKVYAITFFFVALLSSYFQLLYAWAHINELAAGTGVAVEWTQRLEGLVNARLIIAPLALPIISIFYTLAGLGKGGETQRMRATAQREVASVATPLQANTQRINVSVDRLPSEVAQSYPEGMHIPEGLQWHNGGYVERDGDVIAGYVCPGCGKQLSVAGWSRHRRSCSAYASISHTNGHQRSE